MENIETHYLNNQLEDHVPVTLAMAIRKDFTQEQIKIFRTLNYTYHANQNIWGLAKGELQTYKNQTGQTTKFATEEIITLLNHFQTATEKEVMDWLQGNNE